MNPPKTQTGAAEVVQIADVQGSPDTRRIPINKVGIKDIRHPVKVKDRSGGEQHTIATITQRSLAGSKPSRRVARKKAARAKGRAKIEWENLIIRP